MQLSRTQHFLHQSPANASLSSSPCACDGQNKRCEQPTTLRMSACTCERRTVPLWACTRTRSGLRSSRSKRVTVRPGQFCLYMLGLHADLMKLWVQMPMERYARSARCFCPPHLKRALTLCSSRSYRTPTRCSWICDSPLRLLVMKTCATLSVQGEKSVGSDCKIAFSVGSDNISNTSFSPCSLPLRSRVTHADVFLLAFRILVLLRRIVASLPRPLPIARHTASPSPGGLPAFREVTLPSDGTPTPGPPGCSLVRTVVLILVRRPVVLNDAFVEVHPRSTRRATPRD